MSEVTTKIELEVPKAFLVKYASRMPKWVKQTESTFISNMVLQGNYDAFFKKLDEVTEQLTQLEKAYLDKLNELAACAGVPAGEAPKKRGRKPKNQNPMTPDVGSPSESPTPETI